MKLSDLKDGDKVIVDRRFSCMKAGRKTVLADGVGLYVECRAGKHYLDGQESDDGDLIGISVDTDPGH